MVDLLTEQANPLELGFCTLQPAIGNQLVTYSNLLTEPFHTADEHFYPHA